MLNYVSRVLILFLCLSPLVATFIVEAESASSYGKEWELAQGELCRLVEYRCPLDMLDCVRACVRLVALSVEASLAKRYVLARTAMMFTPRM